MRVRDIVLCVVGTQHKAEQCSGIMVLLAAQRRASSVVASLSLSLSPSLSVCLSLSLPSLSLSLSLPLPGLLLDSHQSR